jgi:hypothetical protein
MDMQLSVLTIAIYSSDRRHRLLLLILTMAAQHSLWGHNLNLVEWPQCPHAYMVCLYASAVAVTTKADELFKTSSEAGDPVTHHDLLHHLHHFALSPRCNT